MAPLVLLLEYREFQGRNLSCLDFEKLKTPQAYLVDERGKAVVETFDLLLLLLADGVDTGVDVNADRGQQALVDGHSCDGPRVHPPLAHPWDGVGPQGDTAEAPCGRTQAWAAAVFVSQTHICCVCGWRERKRPGG